MTPHGYGMEAGYALATADAAAWLRERGWHEAAAGLERGAHRGAS
jgi:pantoate kinase